MRVVHPAPPRREPIFTSALIVGLLILLTAAVMIGAPVTYAAPTVGLVALIAVMHERLLAWHSQLAMLVLVILFVPIKRYTLPGGLPFHLELYRLLVSFVFVFWLTSLLIDRRVRLRATGFEGPIWLFVLAIVLSIVANKARVNGVNDVVVKAVTFFLSYLFVVYIVTSLLRRPKEIDFVVRILAGGGAVLAVFALIESATGYNVFNHLSTAIPIMRFDASQINFLPRGGRLRVYASAQHPIALSAAFGLLLPLAVYRAKAFGQRRWWLAAALLLMGLLATRSRTGVVMILAALLVYLVLRAKDVGRLWPAVIPMLIVIHFAVPGALGTIKSSFFPKGGLIAEQRDTNVGSGRIATLAPALDKEWKPHPVFGEGFGSRITTNEPGNTHPQNGPILDDAWLGILLETGIVGTFALVWLFIRSLRRMGKAAKRDPSPRGWLLAGTTASAAAYGVSMFTYDAFSFIQVTFLFFIVLGIGAATLASRREDWEDLERRAAHAP